jgi:hypothetical protein
MPNNKRNAVRRLEPALYARKMQILIVTPETNETSAAPLLKVFKKVGDLVPTPPAPPGESWLMHLSPLHPQFRSRPQR